jgi:hypothetical protein
VIEHIVVPTDTIQGLCLRYRISALQLRQHNNFSGQAFRSKRSLRIPIEPGLPISIQQQAGNKEIIIQAFMNESGEADREARFYLNGNDWDVNKALEEWRADDSGVRIDR